ncbi:MAG: RNA methyltransferase [Bacteroidetes bacterium]|nr:MAG: RNA methyltransferase [Bacteroidota bacterium]
MEMLVKTLAGLEEVLAEELRTLGATEVVLLKRAVRCEGDLSLLYRANLWLRTGLRILIPVETFAAPTEKELYNFLREIDWSRYIHIDQTFAVDVVTQSVHLTHSHFLALRTKDAIVDWFRDHNRGKRPDIDTREADIRIHLHIDSLDRATLLLDSSGDGLHRRGYRTEGGPAPLNEVLAAGLVKLSGWQPGQPLVDMMCGSGTILIEAGLMATNQPPSMNRNFCFENWPDFDRELWQQIKQEAKAVQQPYLIPIVGLDKDFKAFRIAENNIAAAHLEEVIFIQRMSFQNYQPPAGPGMVISNPPYGLRVEDDNLGMLYKEIGDKLKTDFLDYQAWLFSGNMEALKSVGLRASRKISLLNGQLECKFQRYDIYAGTKKVREQPSA